MRDVEGAPIIPSIIILRVSIILPHTSKFWDQHLIFTPYISIRLFCCQSPNIIAKDFWCSSPLSPSQGQRRRVGLGAAGRRGLDVAVAGASLGGGHSASTGEVTWRKDGLDDVFLVISIVLLFCVIGVLFFY